MLGILPGELTNSFEVFKGFIRGCNTFLVYSFRWSGWISARFTRFLDLKSGKNDADIDFFFFGKICDDEILTLDDLGIEMNFLREY